MGTSTPTQPPERQDRLLRERVHDTYKRRGQPKGPARCPDCGAIYHRGRWSWTAEAPQDAAATRCSACQRIADDYPAGELTLTGAFAIANQREILNLVRNIENTENREHPMNRIMRVREEHDRLLITTTDIHLPKRIGRALQRAWEGELDIHFDEAGYYTRISWQRD
jgi:hypothetical protein